MLMTGELGVSPRTQKSSHLEVPPRSAYVVDDDSDLRASLQFLLGSRQIGVMPFASGLEFLSQVSTLRPAPILLDVRMRHMDGMEVLKRLSQVQNKWPVIVITGHGDIGLAVNALKLGAHDFLEKPVRIETLMIAIDSAFDRLAGQIAFEVRCADVRQRVAMLTAREFEVTSRLSAGSSNKQVAFELSISPRTVEMHRANAFRHLKVRTLVEAAALLAKPEV